MSRRKAILIGIGFIALFFVIDAAVDVLLFDEHSLVDHFLHPEPKELWMHLLTALVIIFAVYLRYALKRERESEEKFKAFFDRATDGILIADPENKKFVMANSKIAGMVGYSADEITTLGLMDIHPAKDLPFVMDQFERQERGEFTVAVDIPVQRKDGSIFYADISASPVPCFGRKCLMGIFRDVTERKKTEDAATRFSESIITQAGEMAKLGAWTIEISNHENLNANPLRWSDETYRILGYKPGEVEVTNDFFFERVHPEDRQKIVDAVAKAIADKKPYSIEHRIFRSDGTEIIVWEHAEITFDEQGRPLRMIGAFQDITGRKKMEEELSRLSHDWEDTFDSITDMITIHDRDFNIIRSNRAAKKILHLPVLKDLKEKKCFKYYHGTACPLEKCPTYACLKTGEPSSIELFEPQLNRDIEIRVIPRFDSSKNISGFIHVVRDITERKKLEAQLQQSQKMETIGTLAGGVAHDFNNILTAIIGYGNILKMKLDKEDSPLLGYTDQILASADRAANLTQSLLAFSRKQVMNPKPVNLNEIVISVEKLLLRIIGEDVRLKRTFSGKLKDLRIMADAGQMEQVLMNLAANARDAMPEGGTLAIDTNTAELDPDLLRLHGYGKAGPYALLTVTDTGKGMDEKTRQRIFEPFFTTKEVGKGTGLGLSMVYGIIKQHDGYINCYSEPGKGTSFKIYLPLIEREAEKPKEEHVIVAGGTETILLAEDEDEVRKLMKLVLEEAGYKIIEAADGKEALEKFREQKDKINLLLLDVIMPMMNGRAVFEEARKIRPEIKTLFSSGYPADFIHRQGILGEEVEIISKPVPPHELLKKIREVLDK